MLIELLSNQYSLVEGAAMYAAAAHKNQFRKYTNEKYFVHLKEVAEWLMWAECDEETIAAGYLHDIVEDQHVSFEYLTHRFGGRVSQLVREVTDVSKPEDGNRTVRKALDREHLMKASPEGKTIKLADIISNTSSIKAYDPKFAVVYLEDKKLLLPHLTEGHKGLYEKAYKAVYE